MLSIRWSIFENYAFVLKPKFCPKGPPEKTTEEGAAHHFLLKTLLEIPETTFSNEFFKIWVLKGKLHVKAEIPGNSPPKNHVSKQRIHFSGPSYT